MQAIKQRTHSEPKFRKTRTIVCEPLPTRSKFLIFIKPWDDAVFLNLIKLLEYVEQQEKNLGICIEVVLPSDLQTQVVSYMSREDHNSTLNKTSFTVFDQD